MLLVLTQWVVVCMYAKFGYMNSNPSSAYAWEVFFAVSNQLILMGWVLIPGKSKWSRQALIFNGFIAVIWANWYIPPVKFIVTHYGLFLPLITYVCLCVIVTIILKLARR